MQFSVDIPIVKTIPSKRQVFGWANVSVNTAGETVVDLQNDEIPPEELETAAYKYVIRYREGGVEHSRLGVASLIESVFFSPEKLVALGLAADSLPTAWWVGFRVDDPDVWSKVESGELRAFSIGGTASRVPVT